MGSSLAVGFIDHLFPLDDGVDPGGLGGYGLLGLAGVGAGRGDVPDPFRHLHSVSRGNGGSAPRQCQTQTCGRQHQLS